LEQLTTVPQPYVQPVCPVAQSPQVKLAIAREGIARLNATIPHKTVELPASMHPSIESIKRDILNLLLAIENRDQTHHKGRLPF
jgi:hypothetical protein